MLNQSRSGNDRVWKAGRILAAMLGVALVCVVALNYSESGRNMAKGKMALVRGDQHNAAPDQHNFGVTSDQHQWIGEDQHQAVGTDQHEYTFKWIGADQHVAKDQHEMAEDHTVPLVPFFRYWNSGVGDHFYTTNPHEIGTTRPGVVGRYGYRSEGIACFIAKQSYRELVPLYRYYNGHSRDHFYTTNGGEIGTTHVGHVGRYGYRSEGVAGYCSKTRRYGSVPLFRYWNPFNTDHFYTTNWAELGHGRHGYRYEGVQCYVWRGRYAHLMSALADQHEDLVVEDQHNVKADQHESVNSDQHVTGDQHEAIGEDQHVEDDQHNDAVGSDQHERVMSDQHQDVQEDQHN